MWTVLIELLKALLEGDFKRLWAEHKESEAQNAVNKDMASSDADALQRLSKYTRE